TRRALLEAHSQGRAGYTAPDEQGRWVQVHGDNALTLFGLNEAPVVYKIFPMLKGWQLLTICRSRQTYGPANSVELPHETFLDLVIFLVSSTDDLIRADLKDYFPEVTVLDFVTADTVKDRLAVEDLAVIAPTFADCLTCHASVEDPLALDVLTVTSINGHSCAGLMAQFKLLPLKWESDRFAKPHDRGAPPEPERPRTEPEKGIYFHERGQ
ncbi:MAG: hypothetical protein LBP95_06670, partial [Deltaproteobacteria bacterium]|nr:hypothetical protein [Deltaproteobacteria bacterium]